MKIKKDNPSQPMISGQKCFEWFCEKPSKLPFEIANKVGCSMEEAYILYYLDMFRNWKGGYHWFMLKFEQLFTKGYTSQRDFLEL